MRLVSLALVLLIALAQPATAGDADSPDITDPCGQDPITSTTWVDPAADICGGWFSADVSGPDVVLRATIRTLEPSRDDLRFAQVSFEDGDCTWTAHVSDALVTVEQTTIPVGDGAVHVLPGRFAVGLAVECGAAPGPCTPDTPICSTTTYDRRASVRLPADAVHFDGTDTTITLDMGDLPLAGTEVEGESIDAGETLTGLVAFTSTTAQNVWTPAGVIASTNGFYAGTRTADVATGERYTVPVPTDG